MAEHNKLGQLGENIACQYLQKNGYTIIARNWRFGKAEIDIIATINNVYVFVEVKTRRSTLYGSPEESITQRKETMMIDAATQYVITNQHEGEIRFDIMSIVIAKDNHHKIQHFIDAFFPTI